MTLNDFLKEKTKWNDEWIEGWHFTAPLSVPMIKCKDGFSFKVSIGENCGSIPSDNNTFPYTHFGILSRAEIPIFDDWKAGYDDRLDMYIYAFVPEVEAEELICMHGGLANESNN